MHDMCIFLSTHSTPSAVILLRIAGRTTLVDSLSLLLLLPLSTLETESNPSTISEVPILIVILVGVGVIESKQVGH